MANATAPKKFVPKRGERTDSRIIREEVLEFRGNNFGDALNDATPWFDLYGVERFVVDAFDEATSEAFDGKLSVQYATSFKDGDVPDGPVAIGDLQDEEVGDWSSSNPRRNEVQSPERNERWGTHARVVVTEATTDPAGALVVRVYLIRRERR